MAIINLLAIGKLCEKHPWIKDFYLLIFEESQDVLVQAKTASLVNNGTVSMKISECKMVLQKFKNERNEDTYEEAVYKEELDIIEKEFERLIGELENCLRPENEDIITKTRKCILECLELEKKIKERKLRLGIQ